MLKKQVLLGLVLAGMALGVHGCVIAMVGAGAAGTVAYIKGELKAMEPKPLDVVYAATEQAMEQLELNVTKKTKDAMSALIVVRDSQDKKITVKLSATTEETTKLIIRIGMFGDETKSRLIYNQIRENLE